VDNQIFFLFGRRTAVWESVRFYSSLLDFSDITYFMLGTLLSHQWKETRRSSVFQKNVAVNIILGLFILYFLLVFLALGIFMDKILLKAYPGQRPEEAFHGFLFYYFLVDLFFRFLLQELPVMSIQHYLHLPIRKSRLIHYVLLKSLPSLFNVGLLLIFVPFMVQVLFPAYGAGVSLTWLAALVLLTLCNNFVLIYFKRQLTAQPRLTLLFGLLIGALMLLDYLDWLSLRQAATAAFGFLLQQPAAVALPAGLLGAVYTGNYAFLKAHTYPEEIAVRKNYTVATSDIAFLNRFGEVGKLIALEMKLIWRHKRSKSVVMMSVFFMFYGLIFYRPVYMDGFAMLIFVGLILSGMFMFNYGQFVPSWQSGHFDALLTRRISPYQFYQAKFWFFVPITTLCFLLTLPYGLLGMKIVIINLATFLFNIGINVFVIFYFSVYNKSRIDLSKSSAFNWQGVGASKFVMMLPVMAGPILIYAPFGYLDLPYWGICTLGALGVLGLAFHRQLLQMTANRFQEHKYRMAAGFRSS
jgi:Family of unknown function (DUF5687)